VDAAVALASEIGPGFSPDIKASKNLGFSPQEYVLNCPGHTMLEPLAWRVTSEQLAEGEDQLAVAVVAN
jgi:hypothetical protein